jgi:ATP-dependent Clp protease protease subunit
MAPDDRVVLLTSPIDDSVANLVVARMLLLQCEDAGADIYLYLNSSGGAVTSALAMIDVMDSLSCPVSTVCIRQASGVAAMILACGAPGKRRALRDARIELAPTQGKARNPSTAREVARMDAFVVDRLASATGQSRDAIVELVNSRATLSANEALQAGFVDGVVDRPRKRPPR